MSAKQAGRVLGFSSLLGILLLTEGASRFLYPAGNVPRLEGEALWRHSPDLGWVLKPHYEGRLQHREFDVEVRTNSRGWRDREYPVSRSHRKRMMVLGDSIGFGWGVEQGKVFSELLEARHPDWEILNTSVPGYGTDQELLFLMDEGVTYRPDLVLLLFHDNDFNNNTSKEKYTFFKPFFQLRGGLLALGHSPVPPSTLVQRLDRFFFRYRALGARTYFATRALGSNVAKRLGLARRRTGVDEYDLTARLVRALDECAKTIDAELIVVNIPLSENKRRFLARLTGQLEVAHLDLTPLFRATDSPTSFRLDRHWNEHGHWLAANGVERFLSDGGWL